MNSDSGGAVVDGRLFSPGSTLMAQTLDVGQRRLTASPWRPGRRRSRTNGDGFSASPNGTLAYARPWPTLGELRGSTGAAAVGDPVHRWRTTWISRFADASRVAVSRVDAQTNTADIWLIDPGRSGSERD